MKRVTLGAGRSRGDRPGRRRMSVFIHPPYLLFLLALLFGLATLLAAVSAHADAHLERGRYIVETIGACGNCHTPFGADGPDPERHLAGGQRFDADGMHVVTPNLTPDPETGLGAWSDEEIIRAFREGIRPDGRVLGPIMPLNFYRGISDEDARAIVAYLRSLPPVHQALEPTRYDFPLPERWGPPLDAVPHPDEGDPIAWGAYLAGPLGHCMECHSRPGRDGVPDYEQGFGAGGWVFNGPLGVSVASNLTPAGLAGRSDEDLRRMITLGVRPDGSVMRPPMPYGHYAGLAAPDLDALIAYLRQLPPR